jgi:hypothetical protein
LAGLASWASYPVSPAGLDLAETAFWLKLKISTTVPTIWGFAVEALVDSGSWEDTHVTKSGQVFG